MPIRPHLNGQRYDSDTSESGPCVRNGAGGASTCRPRRLANEVLAHKIIELAQAGEHDPERLCEAVLKRFSAAASPGIVPAVRPPACFTAGLRVPLGSGRPCR